MFNERDSQADGFNSAVEVSSRDGMEKSQRPHFLDDDKFTLLRSIQQQIFEATEVNPTVRRLVNALITQENLMKVRDRMIESLRG